ncbi:UDP-2,3-diacylglucosamine diphosphatase [bacterium]|nr:UDP-2,3-diacylglucosamine diphosphatase [bacterium]
MGKSFFISDVHLGAESSEKEIDKRAKLIRFLELISDENAQNLFILGDFFDFWFDYKKIIFREYFDILCQLKKLAQNGVQIHFFGGNHDWWMFENGFFARELDAKIYYEPTIIEINSKIFLLGHGDGIAPSDWGYRNLLAPILRNPVSIFLFRLIPAEYARSISRIVSSKSKLYTQERNLHFETEYEEFARTKIADGIDYVIFGHLHLPTLKKIDSGIYANSGDFYQNFTYIVFDNETLELLHL